ncbi:MAG: caspase family protein [Muribaculaceae bacterium]|nr:caspase family protein [Muribaculaceae bacterium]
MLRTLITILISAIAILGAQASEAEIAALTALGERALTDYRAAASAGTPGTSAYSSVQTSFGAYRDAIERMRPDDSRYAQCKSALRELFPLLSDGAYYYASLNRQDKVLDFACAYVDLSLISAMADEHLSEDAGYPILANLAATNSFNRGDYIRATKYFEAYLNTTDTQNRELAFEGLARCFYERRDYDRAVYIVSQGIRYFPNNRNMTLIGIESCGKTSNDELMGPLLSRALAATPNHTGLLEYQGKYFERAKRYGDAADTFRRLYGLNKSSLDYACHLGFNLYNAATEAWQRSKAPGVKSSEASTLTSQAKALYAEAAPVLRDVLANTPYAVNVARALAMCYSINNDGARLKEANTTLSALRSKTVDRSDIPTLDLSYRPTVELAAATEDAGDQGPKSDVDINIPEAGHRNDRTYAVIIGNENYKHHAKVNYARNDAGVFATYCNKVLGIPADNIRRIDDATQAEIKEQVRYLEQKTAMNPDRLNIIFYYAGHGIPDVANSAAYLLPSDVSGTDFETCYSLESLYESFDNMPARNVTVFLDACFSGATRSSGMIFAERFVEYEVEDLVAKGNTVVFSATTGKQTAMGYDEQNHGFFTYYLLKALQETRGDITLRELADRISRDVDNKAFDKKNKHQTPTVKASPALGSAWESRTLLN